MDARDPLYSLSIDKINKIAAKAFEKGLNDDIRKSLVFQNPNSLKEVYDLAKKFEEKEKCKPKDDEKVTQRLLELLKIAEDPNTSKNFTNPHVNRTETVECQLCGGGHLARQCAKNPSNVVCQLCDQQGHSADKCRRSGNMQRGGYNNNRGRFFQAQGFNERNGNFNGGYFERQGNRNNYYNNGYNPQGSFRGRGGYHSGQVQNQGYNYNNSQDRQPPKQ